MSARFQFGHRGRYLGGVQVAIRRTVASHHEGVRFVQERDPCMGGGWRSYFDAPVRGRDRDVALVQAVAHELGGWA